MNVRQRFGPFIVLLILAVIAASCSAGAPAPTVAAPTAAAATGAAPTTVPAAPPTTAPTAPAKAAEASPAGATDTIKVGGITDLTGAGSTCGVPVNEGSRAAFEYVNKQGGVAGHKIDYIVLDHGNDTSRAATNVRRLVEQEKVLAIVSGCSSTMVSGVLPYADQNAIPFIGPYGAVDSLIVPPKKTVFAVLPPYYLQFVPLISWAFKEKGPGTVAQVLFQKSELFDKAISFATAQGGGKVVKSITFSIGQAEWGSTVLQLKDADPDYVAFSGAAQDIAKLIREMERQQYKPKKMILATSGAADITVLQGAGPYANGLLAVANPVVLSDTPATDECNKALGVSRGQATHYQLFGCGVAQVFMKAIERLGKNPTREALVELLNKDFSAEVAVLPGGKAVTAANHLLIGGMFINLAQEGKFVQIADMVKIPEKIE